MIFYFNNTSLWIGKHPNDTFKLLPSTSYFDGGCYWKFSFYWLAYIFEFSGTKKDNKVYQSITKKELEEILKKINKAS